MDFTIQCVCKLRAFKIGWGVVGGSHLLPTKSTTVTSLDCIALTNCFQVMDSSPSGAAHTGPVHSCPLYFPFVTDSGRYLYRPNMETGKHRPSHMQKAESHIFQSSNLMVENEITLGMRVGHKLLLTLQEQQSSRWKQQPECACEPHACLHPWASQEGGGADILQDARLSKSLQKSTGCLRSVMWTLKEAVLLIWLENIGGIFRVRAPAPLFRVTMLVERRN